MQFIKHHQRQLDGKHCAMPFPLTHYLNRTAVQLDPMTSDRKSLFWGCLLPVPL
ncbi:MAG: hypothetical protein AB1589_26400 [Cyanobacteriota bacterium]